MCNIEVIKAIYILISIIITLFYTIFAPEAFFHKTYVEKEKPKLFDRWRDKRLSWNLHQSFIHLIGSAIGFFSMYKLVFDLGLQDPNQYTLSHLVLLLFGIAGIMGFIPRILFGSVISR